MEPSLTSDVFVLKRKPNWSEKELLTLSENVTSNIKIIKGQFGPSLTINDKNACWAHINESVNAINPSHVSRSVADCKKKWQDLQAATKKKEATRRSEARATGGGPPPVCNFKPWESTVLQTLTKTQVEGIEGGVDTLEDDQFGPSTSSNLRIQMLPPPVLKGPQFRSIRLRLKEQIMNLVCIRFSRVRLLVLLQMTS
ncbi:unnamed protein product [Mytilus coruscus]|uniref:Myb/SANT-like DNA-binding domain-containing protein n=1 Tax=Mytilus coruscus TaxID=42192 RepID=A0A6J8BFJ1_MYTCO|nr:unnamed protein product [Mytilus coruscus]